MTESTIETRGRGTSIANENLQESLEASKNGGVGQSAFFTPLEFGRMCAIPLPEIRETLVDLSAGSGQLLIASSNNTTRIGLALDIENCRTKFTEKWPRPDILRIAGDSCKVYGLLKEISFEADCFTLNPPWSLHFYRENLSKLVESDVETVRKAYGRQDSTNGPDCIDSTIAQMMMALDLMTDRGEGFLIANDATLERLILKDDAPYGELASHVWARVILKGNPMTGEAKQTFDKEKDFETGVIWFAKAHYDGLDRDARMRADYLKRSDAAEEYRGVGSSFEECVEQIRMRRNRLRSGVSIVGKYNLREDSQDLWRSTRTEWEIRQGQRKPAYNIYQDPDGSIITYLSVFDSKNVKIPKEEAASLFELNGKRVMELVLMRETRQLLLHHTNGSIWKIHPNLPAAVEKAVAEYHAVRSPLYPLNDTMRLGYLDEEDFIVCKSDVYEEDLIPKQSIDNKRLSNHRRAHERK